MFEPERITWFMVADGAKARLFESKGRKLGWKLVDEWCDADARTPSRELGEDRPKRGRKSGSGGRFAVDVLSEHEKAEEAFIHERAKFLNRAEATGKFDQLVLTAPPSALGAFRKRLSADAAGKYILVLDKDLTNTPPKELYEYFKGNVERW